MARQDPQKLLKRSKDAQVEMDSNRGTFEDAYDYIMPFRNIYSKNSKNHNTNTKQHDSTAMIAANNFVNTLSSKFTPMGTRWASLTAGPAVPEEQRDDVNMILQKINETVFSYINSSNFATASGEMYFDLGIGTGVMGIYEGDEEQPLNFVAMPLAHVALEDGKFGNVVAVFKYNRIKAKLIMGMWPKAKLGEKMTEIIRDHPEKEIEITECFYWSDEEFVWYYDVIHCEESEAIFSSFSLEAPIVTPRWMKIPGFATGIGPFLMAMSDYKTLNKMKELSLKMAALNVFGVYTVANKGAINPNTIKIAPGSFIPVDRNGSQNPSIAPLPRAGDYQIQEFMMTDLKDQTRQVMLDNRLPQESAAVRTAFEISQRLKELSSDIGAALPRLQREYIEALYKRVLEILKKKKLLPIDEEIERNLNIDNLFVSLQIVSPIAQQQQLEDIQKLTQAYELMASISPEQAQMSFDIAKLPKFFVEKTGASMELLRSDEEVQQLQQQQQQAQAAMMAAQAMPQQTQQKVAA